MPTSKIRRFLEKAGKENKMEDVNQETDSSEINDGSPSEPVPESESESPKSQKKKVKKQTEAEELVELRKTRRYQKAPESTQQKMIELKVKSLRNVRRWKQLRLLEQLWKLKIDEQQALTGKFTFDRLLDHLDRKFPREERIDPIKAKFLEGREKFREDVRCLSYASDEQSFIERYYTILRSEYTEIMDDGEKLHDWLQEQVCFLKLHTQKAPKPGLKAIHIDWTPEKLGQMMIDMIKK